MTISLFTSSSAYATVQGVYVEVSGVSTNDRFWETGVVYIDALARVDWLGWKKGSNAVATR